MEEPSRPQDVPKWSWIQPESNLEGVCEASSLLIGIHALTNNDFLSPAGGKPKVTATGARPPGPPYTGMDWGGRVDGLGRAGGRTGGTRHASNVQARWRISCFLSILDDYSMFFITLDDYPPPPPPPPPGSGRVGTGRVGSGRVGG